MTIQILVGLCFMALVAAWAFRYKEGGQAKLNAGSFTAVIAVVFAGALVLRLLLGFTVTGYETDITLFKYWGQLCNQVGFGAVYFQPDVFLDYPPGYLYILSGLDGLRGALNLASESQGYTLLMKLPSMLADLGCGALLFMLAKKRFARAGALFLAGAYLFCPAVIINSTIWGQVDALCTLILLFSLLMLMRGHLVPAAIVYGLAVIFKPQMLIFAPIYLFYTLYRKDFKGLLIGVGLAVLTIMLVATPFVKDWNYLWLIEKYRSTMDYYHYYTVNAFNLWGLLGKNWGPMPEGQPVLEFVLDWIGPVIATALCGLFMYRVRTKATIFAAGAILMSTVFTFSVKMHERYLFPALLLILLTYVQVRDRRILLAFGGLSTVHFLNVAYVLHLNNSYVSPLSIQILLLSALHLAFYGYFIYLCFAGLQEKEPEKALSKRAERAQRAADKGKSARVLPQYVEEPVDRKLHKTDFIVMGAVTVLYALIAFWNLGANVSANTSWTPQEGESVTLEAAEEYDSITFMPGIGQKEGAIYRVGSAVRIETSADGANWRELATLEEEYVYKWNDLSLTVQEGEGDDAVTILPDRYLRLTALDGEVVWNEVALKSTDHLRFVAVTPTQGDATALLDEPGAVPLYPSYYNSTYFDEVYHARTAYEHLQGLEIYENTHPTLGKLIIGLGIRMFGMNPFGWRFMGVVFGILMLPILYHLLKRLFGNSFLCTIGTLLFAFDFMHFTQTRIATIDTYAVFFILLMYDAMLVFCQKDLVQAKLKELLLPLALSGIFMGLGAAAKWTCIYGAVGLAVLFFWKLIRTYCQLKGKAQTNFLNKCIRICLWCLLLFLAIPFAIYFIAYLPLTLLPGNRQNIFGSFMRYQETMFSYHSGLVAVHDFASPWYEWPLDIRSIWYNITYNYDAAGSYSSIAALGNPLLWWSGLLALPVTVWLFVRKRLGAARFVIVGFLSVYLPWVLISRLTFIYHYFTAVPFLVIALMLCFKEGLALPKMGRNLMSRGMLAKVTVGQGIIVGFTALCLLLFWVFFPGLSGAPTSREYLEWLEWLPTWTFI